MSDTTGEEDYDVLSDKIQAAFNKQIGREFSGRNPSTVKHACEKIASELAANPALGRRVREIRSQMNTR